MKINYFLFVLLLFACSCGTKKEEKADVNNEIPVTTSSAEALNDFKTGKAHLDVGNGVAARVYFTQAIEKDPSFASAYMYRAFTSPSNQQFKDDLSAASNTIEGKSEGEKVLLQLNQTFLTSNMEERLAYAKQLVQLYPKSAEASSILGDCYAQMNDRENSRNAYRKAIELDSTWAGGYFSLATSYMNAEPKDFDQAEKNFTKVVALAPDLSGSHIYLGDAYRAKNNLEKARESYEKALNIDPNDALTFLKRGHVYSFLGEYEKARQDYRKAAELNPENIVAPTNFEAFTYLYAGDSKKAKSWLEDKANTIEQLGIKENQKNNAKLGFLTTCGMIAFHSGQADEVKRIVELMKPLSAEVGNIIGTDEARRGQKSNMLLWDAYVFAMKKDFKNALAKAEESKQTVEPIKNPNKLQGYHAVLSYIAYQQGKFDEAVSHQEKANLNNVYDKYWLAKACEKAGQKDRAEKLFAEVSIHNFNALGYALVRKELMDRKKST